MNFEKNEVLLLAIAIIIFICLGVCILMFWYVGKKQKKHLKQILHEQFIGGAIMDANIAQNIHDYVINEQLFDILKHLRPLASNNNDLKLIIRKIEDMEQMLRNISDDIFPAHILVAFVRICQHKIKYLGELYEFDPKKIHFKTEGDFHQIAKQEFLLGLYRLIVSFVGNSLKHHQEAHISAIEIDLSNKNGIIHLLMEDNGLGFDIPKALEWGIEMEHRGLADFQNLAIALSLGANPNDYEFYSISKNLNLDKHGTFFQLKINLPS